MRTTVAVMALAGALAAAGCVPKDPEKIGPKPKAYRAAIAEQIKQQFFDPYSLRDVSISEPAEGYIAMQQGWVVCVRANGKNRMGAYIGMKDTAFLINNERVIGSDPDFPACSRLSFSPWPELDSGPKR